MVADQGCLPMVLSAQEMRAVRFEPSGENF